MAVKIDLILLNKYHTLDFYNVCSILLVWEEECNSYIRIFFYIRFKSLLL